MIFRDEFVSVVPQSLRLWLWIAYYALEGVFATKKEKFESIFKLHRWEIALVSIVILWVWLFFIGKFICGSFICFYIPNWLNKVIKVIASCTMGIYIIHPFVASVCGKFISGVNCQWLLNIICWLVVIIICTVGIAIVNRLPILKELNIL